MSKKLGLCIALMVAVALTAAAPVFADSTTVASWATMLNNAATRINASMPAATFSTVTVNGDTFKRPDSAWYGKTALPVRQLQSLSLPGPPAVTFGPYAVDGTIETAIATAYTPAGSVHGALRIFDLALLALSPTSAYHTMAALQWADMNLSGALTLGGPEDFLAYASLSALGSYYATLGGQGVIILAGWANYLPLIDSAFATPSAWVNQVNTRLTALGTGDAQYDGALGASIVAFMQHGGSVEAAAATSTLVSRQDAAGFFGSGTVANKAWNTALAICGLEAVDQNYYATQIKSAMNWLASNQLADGTWGGSTLLETLRIAAFVVGCGGTALTDTTPPAVAITAPTNPVVCGSSVAVVATASDNIEVNRVEFILDASIAAFATDSTSPFQAVLDTTTLSVGAHVLSAKAYDNSGNQASNSLSIFVDNTAPNAPAITSPAASALVSGTISVAVNASDTAGGSGICLVKLYEGATLLGSTLSSPYLISVNTALFSDGTHTLSAVASDCCLQDSATSPTVAVVYDNTLPSCSLVLPTVGATVSGAAVTLSADATDANPGVKVKFYVDNALQGEDTTESGGSPTHLILWNSAAVADGVHSLKAVATDAALNTKTSASRLFIVDNIGPSVALTAPLTNDVISGSLVAMSATASDPLYGVADVKFRYQQGAGAVTEISADVTAPYTAVLDTTGLSDGTVALSAVATSAGGGGLSATDTKVAIVDNIAPAVSISAPAASAFVAGVVAVSANATDTGAGIDNIAFYVDGTAPGNSIGTDTTAPYSVNWNTALQTDATHVLYAIATDKTAKATVSAGVIVTVSNHGTPGVAWLTPSPGAVVHCHMVALSVDASEAIGIQKVTFYIDGTTTVLGEDTTAAYGITWDSHTASLGSHILWARATDNASNTKDATIAVLVDNAAPILTTFDSPTPAADSTVGGTMVAPVSVTIKVTPTDSPSGVASATIQVWRLSPLTKVVDVTVASPGPYQTTWATTYLNNGAHQIRVTAVDNATNAITAPGLTRNFTVNNATFTDVPYTHLFWLEIERVKLANITAGCGGGNYCPDAAVSRAQMAIFLVKAKGEATKTDTTTFSDVTSSNAWAWAYGYVERLVADGITSGCDLGPPRLYCPGTDVSRAQMAVFLVKALGLTPYIPGTPTFTDVQPPVSTWGWAYGYVERIALLGITSGCTTTTYCPGNAVTRGQMAKFLKNAFNLPGPP